MEDSLQDEFSAGFSLATSPLSPCVCFHFFFFFLFFISAPFFQEWDRNTNYVFLAYLSHGLYELVSHAIVELDYTFRAYVKAVEHDCDKYPDKVD